MTLGMIGSSDWIIRTSAAMSSDENGPRPVIISYVRQPRHHQSSANEYGWPVTSSGAMYSGVPTVEPRVFRAGCPSASCIFLAKPKSVILRWPSTPTITFSGFRSR